MEARWQGEGASRVPSLREHHILLRVEQPQVEGAQAAQGDLEAFARPFFRAAMAVANVVAIRP